jgi:hypothetical protein
MHDPVQPCSRIVVPEDNLSQRRPIEVSLFVEDVVTECRNYTGQAGSTSRDDLSSQPVGVDEYRAQLDQSPSDR